MNMVKKTFKTSAIFCLGAMAALLTPTMANASLLLPNIPLFVNQSTTPNIFIQMDDSGSMDWDIMTPKHFTTCRYNNKLGCSKLTATGVMYDWTGTQNNDDKRFRNFEYVYSSDDDAYNTHCHNSSRDVIELCGFNRTGDKPWDWRVKSNSLNALWFNPVASYTPWPTYSNATFASARSYPDPAISEGYSDTRNLSGFEYNYWIDDRGFSGTQPDRTDDNLIPNNIIDQWDSHVRVVVNTSGFECTLFNYSPNSNGLNPTLTTLTASDPLCVAALGNNTSLAQLQQNVANWYQYYRRRNLVAKTAIARVVTDLPSFRYGFGMINDGDTFVQMPAANVTDYASHNAGLIDTYLEYRQQAVGTPLRRGLENVGKYYQGELSGKASPINLSCQKNFALLFSDGYWNGGEPFTVDSDIDGDNGVVFEDTGSETDVLLADVASYYYQQDLSDLPDLVPTDQFDAANHQHLVTYTIGLGIVGSLIDSDGDGWPDNLTSSKWYTDSANDDEKRVDDLWHAAYNSKGKYISAREPQQLISELSNAIVDISDRIGGAASGATNGGSVSSNSKVFQAKFDALDWHGSLLAINIDESQGEVGSIEWEAGAILNTYANSWFTATRKVFTYRRDTNAGAVFNWASLNDDQKTKLHKDPITGSADGEGEARLNYIRGSNSHEGQGNQYRIRSHRLGDIGYSDPEYAGIPPFYYLFGNYQTFALAQQNRPGMVYVGGNDGMLHAFRESDGTEAFAYVPDVIMDKLNVLTDTNYGHEFFVDGSPVYADVQISSSWKSVLIGSMRSGAQGLYALDITNPETFSASNVLWEFTDADDVDLGFVFGEPQIRKMANNKWAAIFSSGYNNTQADDNVSTTGKSYVYILYIEDGLNGWSSSDYRKIELVGADGLSAPAVADVDGDSIADFIYIGDLDGNMWKIDVTATNPASWAVAFGGEPLFVAKTPGGTRQAITNRPAVMRHPMSIREGVMVLFGTGKFLEINDDVTSGYPTQSVYAIWDRDGFYNKAQNTRNSTGDHGFLRNQLENPSMTVDSASGIRIINDYTPDLPLWFDEDGDPKSRGWVVNLPVEGERMINRIVLRDQIAFMVSMIPADDICAAGGSGWLMALNAETGSGLHFPVLDMNDDIVIDEDDMLIISDGEDGDPITVTPVGREMLSIPNVPTFLYDDRASDLGNIFPPRANAPRGCGADSARAFSYTTRTNGSIQMVVTSHQPMSCGRQSWLQKH